MISNNYFSSYKLFEAQKYHNIKAAGTVRAERFGMLNKQKNIDNLHPLRRDKELKKCARGTIYEIKSADKQIALVSYYDNKCVNIGSNFILAILKMQGDETNLTKDM